MTTDNNNDVLFSEAPASWNTPYVTPDGFECQLTIRGEKVVLPPLEIVL